MEIGLHGLVTGLLIVSIIGIAYVYGFNLETGSLLDNISAAVRALGVDGGFFLGLYFSRRLWMRRKRGWGDGIKTTLFGFIWFLVALLMASLSWFSNTLLEQMRQWTRAKLAHEAADICSAFLFASLDYSSDALVWLEPRWYTVFATPAQALLAM